MLRGTTTLVLYTPSHLLEIHYVHRFDRRERGFHVLSLDGGGIRGAYTAALLATWEAELRRPIGDFFDLIVGTSTGGIIALALAKGVPASRIESIYANAGSAIFSRRAQLTRSRILQAIVDLGAAIVRRPTIDIDALLQTRYDPSRLRAELAEVLGDATLDDLRCRVVIPSVDLIRGTTSLFATPHLPGNLQKKASLVDVALSTSAAPTYFPPHSFDLGQGFCDGGLWANNPSVVAYSQAHLMAHHGLREGNWTFTSISDLRILSIGTGMKRIYVDPKPNKERGALWWGARIFDVAAEVQSEGYANAIGAILGNRFQRINFTVPDNNWSLDNTSVLQELLTLGRTAAITEYARVASEYFATIAQPFRRA